MKTLIIVISFLISNLAFAGSNCQARNLGPEELIKATETANNLYKELNSLNPKMALIARIGSDVSKYNLKYTHLAFVFKEFQGNKWNVIHLLNHCGTDNSDLFSQGLVNFYLDDPFKYDTLILIPKKDAQNKIVSFFATNKYLSLFNPNYSTIAYPFSTKYQNSNQWIIEVMTAALVNQSNINRQEVQNYMAQNGFIPSKISVGGFERLGAGIASNNIRFDDHPREEDVNHTYSIVSVESVIEFLNNLGYIEIIKEMR